MILTYCPMSPSIATITKKSVFVESVKETKLNFLVTLDKEVKQFPKRGRKLRRLLITTHSMCVSMFLAQPAFAATSPELDPDVQQTILILEITCAILAASAAIIGLMAAGVWKMYFGGKQADEWTTNIYKGLGQVIVAPIGVALIVGMAVLLFSGIPAFQPIGEALNTWFSK